MASLTVKEPNRNPGVSASTVQASESSVLASPSSSMESSRLQDVCETLRAQLGRNNAARVPSPPPGPEAASIPKKAALKSTATEVKTKAVKKAKEPTITKRRAAVPEIAVTAPDDAGSVCDFCPSPCSCRGVDEYFARVPTVEVDDIMAASKTLSNGAEATSGIKNKDRDQDVDSDDEDGKPCVSDVYRAFEDWDFDCGHRRSSD